MASVRSTRLRFIAAKDKLDLVLAIERLPFKVEMKAIQPDGKKGWVAFFVIPDAYDFESIEL